MFRDRLIAPLRPFVRYIWYFEGPDLAHSHERVLPDGAMQLLVNLHEDELRWWDGDGFSRAHHLSGAAVSGAYGRPVLIDTAEQRRITGVSFAPGGATAVLGESALELADAQPELADVWTDEPIRERLLEAGSPEAIFDAWERVLLERLRGGRDRHVEHALEAFEIGRAVRDVARDLGWSAKRLRCRFADRVGLRPKRYARIRRLQRVIAVVAPGGGGALGPARGALRLSRSGAPHPRLPRAHRADADAVPAAQRRRRQPRHRGVKPPSLAASSAREPTPMRA